MVVVLTGLTTAAILFIVAVGLSLIFGTMRTINMAHGTFYMIGAFFVTITLSGLARHAGGFLLSLIIAAGIGALLGAVVEMLVLRRLYQSEHLLQLLATWALMLILEELTLLVWGTSTHTGTIPAFLSGSIPVAGQPFPVYDLFLIGAAAVIALGLWLLIQRTQLCRLIRAAVQDTELVMALGVNVRRMYTQVFAIGALLSSLGGALIAPSTSSGPGMDVSIIIDAFIVSVIGGLGSIWGTAAGAVIIGLFQSVGSLVAPELAGLAPYLVMVLVLIVRPQGLFGKVEA